MPLYEYSCTSCKRKFQVLRPFSRADEEASCPTCKGPGKKLISAFACVSKDSEGFSTPMGGGGGCGGCTATSCSTCH
ncbi:MAG: zinc ribbon domain-containing protein [Chloroflexi bacterium]|nr:zinc ribbon domain-containing protein [Chloroflexota bacterium]